MRALGLIMRPWSLIYNGFKLKKKLDHHATVSNLLFRGQCDSRWGLSNTLERYTQKTISLKSYYRYLRRIQSAVESYTNRLWTLEGEDEFEKDHVVNLPGYPLMVYARHHGFPPPLLDWTRSPYIALFFAFANATACDRVAVYAFIERPEGTKTGFVNAPKIIGQGPYATTHERHFTQQAEYSICIERPADQWLYTSHDNYFRTARDDQDFLRKIILPISLKNETIKQLDLMNINEYSLFRTEEGLMSMLAYREIGNDNL